MSCTTVAFAGAGSCKKLLSKVAGVSLIKKGNTFTDALFGDETTWHTKIAAIAGMEALPLRAKNYENTTDDVTIETSALGIKDVTDVAPPSIVAYVDASACDYKTFHQLDGQEFDVTLHLKDGTLVGTRTTGLVNRGMRAVVYTRVNAPLADSLQNSYPLYIMFRDTTEFENAVYTSPDFSLQDLLDFVPVGLDLKITTAYAAAQAVVRAVTRCTSTGKTGGDADDWYVIETNADDVDITASVDDGNGFYTIDVKKDASGVPATLATGEYAIIQMRFDDATYYTYSSNTIRIQA